MIIDTIKSLLTERNMTFQDLSNELGVDRANLYKCLTTGNPTLERLTKISSVLNVSVSDLFPSDDKQINGFVEYDGCIYKINSIQSLQNLIDLINTPKEE